MKGVHTMKPPTVAHFTQYIQEYTQLTEQQRQQLLFALIRHLGLSVYLTDATKPSRRRKPRLANSRA